MDDLSIDLETLSLRSNAAVLSIGAAFFNPHSGRIGETFYRNIVVGTDSGGDKDPYTMAWWAKQDRKARAAFDDPLADPARVVLAEFLDWVERSSGYDINDVKPWGNGSVFDVVILENSMSRNGVRVPWNFWNVRDVRTVADWGEVRSDMIPFEGEKHNALHDAIHQAKIVTAAYAKIGPK